MKTETCLNDVFITIKDDTLIIEREEGLLSLGTSDLGGGLGMIKSIVIGGLKSPEDSSPSSLDESQRGLVKFLEVGEALEPAAVTIGSFNIASSVNVTNDKVTALVMYDESIGLPASVTVLVDEDLDEPALLELFKAAAEGKNAALWDLGMINGLSLDLFDSGNYDSILVACTGLVVRKQVKKPMFCVQPLEHVSGKRQRSCLRTSDTPGMCWVTWKLWGLPWKIWYMLGCSSV